MLSKRIRLPNIRYRYYHKKVVEHFENPSNIGSFDKNEPNVYTSIVGAPACIHEDTIIAVAADGRREITIKDLYLENNIIQVWSYNIKDDIYEIKNARVIKNEFTKNMKKIIFDDDSFIICTDDHKFLLKNNNYLEVKNIKKNISIVPFKRRTTKIKKIEDLEGNFDCYDLQVEENNNFAVITKKTKNIHSGIIIRNCGDVLKLQIKVENDTIVDCKTKVFGCGSAIAASSYATELIKNKKIDDVIQITNYDIANHLNLPPVKLHCSMLAEDAIKSAIKDYKNKN